MRIRAWAESPHRRIFPTGNTPRRGGLRIDAARNETVAFQVCVTLGGEGRRAPAGARSRGLAGTVQETAEIAVSCESTRDLSVRIRRVGFVPLPHHNTETDTSELDGVGHVPGYVPDPLYEEQGACVYVGETVSFWLSVQVSPNAAPGASSLPVVVYVDGKQSAEVSASIQIFAAVMKRRTGFHVTHWFYNDAILDWHRLQAFERRFWDLLPAYIRNCAEHGQDTLYVPVFTPPLDGVKRPTQLLRVKRTGRLEGRQYGFDWTDVKRYVDIAKRCGMQFFEWTHFFWQWGCRYALRIYEDQGHDERLLWRPQTPAVSKTYSEFLSEFLPELRTFLDRERILKRSFFHVSDEPQGEEHLPNYRKAKALLGRLAPWMTTMDALSEIAFGRQKVTDMPIPLITVTKRFVEEGIPCWTYFCAGPRGPYLNRLMDTPLAKIRMAGWLFYRFGLKGFLHWGYNYWYRSQTRTLIDPFCEASGKRWPDWAYGDPFVVYPGGKGPLDSIRWEIFAASLQDYALLQQSGSDPSGELLRPLEDFHRFPRDEDWWCRARREVLKQASAV
jgi:hypothetical protein